MPSNSTQHAVAVAALLILLCVPVLTGEAKNYSSLSTPVNLGAAVNTNLGDFFPAISRDGLTLYFTISGAPDGYGGFDIYVAHRGSPDEPWGERVNLGSSINTANNEGAPSISVDGHVMFFASDREGGFGGNDVYVSRRHDKRDDFGWEPAENLGASVNTNSNESSPEVWEAPTNGKRILYFDSNRPGGPGPGTDDVPAHNGNDIYVSSLQPDGTFGNVSLVTELSTPFLDRAPTIRRDGLEIYIASDRPGTLGGLDIWVATRASTSDPWSTPVNVGAVNSAANDVGPALSFDETTLYLQSARPGGFGLFDLYASMRSKDRSTCLTPTTRDIVTDSVALPATPCGLTATAVSSTTILVTWTDNSTTEDYFWLERCESTAADCEANPGLFSPFDFILNETVYYDEFLPPNTTYSYRVRAFEDNVPSGYSNIDDAMTFAPMPAPSNLVATALSPSQIDVTWSDNSDREDRFDIERCTGTAALCDSNPFNFLQIASVGANITSFSNTGLSPNTTYSYRVRAATSDFGEGSTYSNTDDATTTSVPLLAPSNLIATALSHSQINLTWSDNSNNESRFDIERCTGTAAVCGANPAAFASIASVGANVTNYSSGGLSGDTTYSYRVRAVTGEGDVSAYSNVAEARTLNVPAAPTNLQAVAGKKATTVWVTLTWTDNSTNETGFKIERRLTGGTFTQISVVGAGVTSYRDNAVVRRVTYEYRVRAKSLAGDSGYSNIASAKTN